MELKDLFNNKEYKHPDTAQNMLMNSTFKASDEEREVLFRLFRLKTPFLIDDESIVEIDWNIDQSIEDIKEKIKDFEAYLLFKVHTPWTGVDEYLSVYYGTDGYYYIEIEDNDAATCCAVGRVKFKNV